ncbi:glycosyltransferase family 39 protein [Candidatus Woesearchaeota archaeon]|nr:glycosyltransferase family 39 protein [Candidatus Woesearchaeota archaeon]
MMHRIEQHLRSSATVLKIIAIGSLVCIAFVLRLWGLDNGLPFAQMPDESADITTSLQIASGKQPTYLYHRVGWPVFQLPMHALHFAVKAATTPGFGLSDFQDHFYRNRWTFIYSARLLVALVSSLSIVFAFGLGRALCDDDRGGYVMALLFCGHAWFNYITHTALPDGFAFSWIIVALFASAMIAKTGQRWAYLLAGASVAVVTLARLQAFTIFIPVGLAHIIFWFQTRERTRILLFTRWLWSFGAFIVVQIFLNPFIVLNFSGTVADVQSITSQYSSDSLTSSIQYALQNFPFPIILARPYILAAAVIGLGYAMVRRNWTALSIALFGIVFGASIIGRRYPTPNFFLPFAASALALAGFGLANLVASHQKVMKLFGFGALIVIVGISFTESGQVSQILAHPNTRMAAYSWITQNIKTGSRILIGEPIVYSVPLFRTKESIRRMAADTPVSISPSMEWQLTAPPIKEPPFNLYAYEYQSQITDERALTSFVKKHNIEYIVEADYCAGGYSFSSGSSIEFPVIPVEYRKELILETVFSPFAQPDCAEHVPERLHLQRMNLSIWNSVGPVIRIYRVPQN